MATLRILCVNVKWHWILPTKYTYLFHIILTIKSNYFRRQLIRLVFIMEQVCVLCEMQREFLLVPWTDFMLHMLKGRGLYPKIYNGVCCYTRFMNNTSDLVNDQIYISEENEKIEAKIKFDILNFAFPFPQKRYNVTDVCVIYIYVTVARISVIYEIC